MKTFQQYLMENDQLYFASHKEIEHLIPREVENYNSLGTWLTSSKENAQKLYGSAVYSVPMPKGRFLEAHTQDFLAFFASNADLLKKAGLDKEAKTIEKRKPNEKRYYELEKKLNRDFSLSKSEEKEYRELCKSNNAANKAMLSKKYMQEFKNLLISAGYDGIVWKDSTIDGLPHDVYLVFHQIPIPIKKI